MIRNIFSTGICAILLAGCLHEDSSTDPRVDVTVSGFKTLSGKERFIFVHIKPGQNSAGADKLYFTGDDLITEYDAMDVTESSKIDSFKVTDAGDDGQWFTDDDVISNWNRTETEGDDLSLTTYFSSAGADQQWFTEDDVVSLYTKTIKTTGPDGESNEKYFRYEAPGIDNQWFTEDDVLESYDLSQSIGDGEEKRCLYFYRAGQDTILNTEDDLVTSNSYCTQAYKKDIETNTTYTLKTYVGEDIVFDTADDVNSIEARRPVTVDMVTPSGDDFSYGGESLYEIISDAGLDGEWLTEDDILSHKSTTEILQEQQTAFSTRDITWLAGANGILGDDDDIVERYSQIQVNIDDEKITDIAKYYQSAGPDQQWFTTDDELDYMQTNIYFWSTYPQE